MKRIILFVILFVGLFGFSGCSAPDKPMPTREKAMELFGAHYELINSAATLIWEHYAELDRLVNEGESRLLLYNYGRTKDDFPYNRTSFTQDETYRIFEAWRVLETNGVSVTYHMSLSNQAPVIAIHCGFDEMGRSFGYFYIRPVDKHEEGLTLQDTVDMRIRYNNYSNPNSYVEWLPLEHDYWYRGTTTDILRNVTE